MVSPCVVRTRAGPGEIFLTVTIYRALAGAREAVAERSGGWSCELMIKDFSRHHNAAVWVILGIRNSREKYYSGKLATLSPHF